MTERKIMWSGGSIACDFCGEVHAWFVDGATIDGPWAIMCPRHFMDNGVGLGLGKGQEYDSVTLQKIGG